MMGTEIILAMDETLTSANMTSLVAGTSGLYTFVFAFIQIILLMVVIPMLLIRMLLGESAPAQLKFIPQMGNPPDSLLGKIIMGIGVIIIFDAVVSFILTLLAYIVISAHFMCSMNSVSSGWWLSTFWKFFSFQILTGASLC